MVRTGNLFILSGPSGVGKGTVLEQLLEQFEDIQYSVSVTTRPKRKCEVDGEDYCFITEDKFFEMVDNNEFIEWAKVHNNYYGTPFKNIEKFLKRGKDIILEIDIQGARKIRDTYDGGIFIFLEPPSFAVLYERLKKRGSEDEENLKIRLDNARQELEEKSRYDYAVLNDNIKKAVDKLRSIIIAEKCRVR